MPWFGYITITLAPDRNFFYWEVKNRCWYLGGVLFWNNVHYQLPLPLRVIFYFIEKPRGWRQKPMVWNNVLSVVIFFLICLLYCIYTAKALKMKLKISCLSLSLSYSVSLYPDFNLGTSKRSIGHTQVFLICEGSKSIPPPFLVDF